MNKFVVGGGIALAAFLITYGIASADDKKPNVVKPTVDKPKPGETIDIAPVKGVQKGLIILGYSVGSTGADDKYGPNTAAAIKKFNKDNGGPDSDALNNPLRVLLANSLRKKGYTVVGESGPVFENKVKYSSGLPGSTALTKTDAYNIGCKRGKSDGKEEAEANEKSNPKWEPDSEDKTAFEAYTKFKSDFESGYRDCYITEYNKYKPWYEEGLTVTSTGKSVPRTIDGQWGKRNRILALAKINVVGRKFEIL